MSEFIFKNKREDYLSPSKYIDWTSPAIIDKANEFKERAEDEIQLIKMIYEYVRDEVKHSWDIGDKRVTITASDVLKQKVGICWAKSNLLAALLRASGIPAGICYQRLTLGETKDTGFCAHALNVVYIKRFDKWIRLDARGNKPGVNAQFDLNQEHLAFPVRREIGEIDYKIIYADASPKLMNVLEHSDDILDTYLHRLPDTVFEWKRATIKDINELVDTRITVLRAANKLTEDVDMAQVQRESYAYYKQALTADEHTAYLIYDGNEFIGTGGISYYQVMPTYHNPSGRKAYIMNMYTAPEYRRKGIAFRTLDLLVKDAREKEIISISLEATDAARPLYEKYGFTATKEMEVDNHVQGNENV